LFDLGPRGFQFINDGLPERVEDLKMRLVVAVNVELDCGAPPLVLDENAGVIVSDSVICASPYPENNRFELIFPS
jgi:hypothetical protein